jgi:hypothetical protein
MPRKRRDEEVIISFWKQFARDASCPWALRVYCVNNLALATNLLTETLPIPGTAQRNKAIEPSPLVSQQAPTPIEAAAANAVEDMKRFMKQLGGTPELPTD